MVVALLIALLVAPAGLAADERISVAVMDFEDAQVQSNRWWKEHWEVGRQFTELVTSALVGKGNFKVIERTRLDQIMKEQGFQTSGAVDTSTGTDGDNVFTRAPEVGLFRVWRDGMTRGECAFSTLRRVEAGDT